MPPAITAELLVAPLAPIPAVPHHVRLVLSVDNTISLFRVRVEGEFVPKWISIGGFLLWENKTQPVRGTLDIELEIFGSPTAAVSLATVCDGKQCGLIDLIATHGQNHRMAAYVV